MRCTELLGLRGKQTNASLLFAEHSPSKKQSHCYMLQTVSTSPLFKSRWSRQNRWVSSHLVPVEGVVQRQSPILQWKEQLCPRCPPGSWSSIWQGCISCFPPVSTNWGVCRRSAACGLLRGLWGCSLVCL